MNEKISNNNFSFIESKNKVIIFWQNKQVMILKDKNAIKFLNKVLNKSENEIQLELAKITGNFKRGNEKNG